MSINRISFENSQITLFFKKKIKIRNMQAVIRGSREQISSDILEDSESPVNDVEEAFERTTLSISREKIVKGKFPFVLLFIVTVTVTHSQ